MNQEETERAEESIAKGLAELEKNYDQNMSISEAKRKTLNEDLIRDLRRRAKTDLFFLAYSVLGYDRLSENLHGHLCAWMEKNRSERYTEILLPRAHFKSTIVTISDVIQAVLPDDVGDQPHPYHLGTNARILICHEVATMASGYLYSITQHFMSNPMLMALFPECVPTPKKHKINNKELVLPRTKIWNEPTIGTMGVGGRSQGLHYDKLVLDDLIGEAARDSETELQSAKLWFDSLPGFFVKLKESKFTVVGTRWGPEDLYDHIEDRYDEQLKVYRRSIIEYETIGNKDGKEIKIEKPIFPEEIGLEDIKILRKNPIVFSAQYMNDPAGGLTHFNEESLRWFGWNNGNQVITVFGSRPFEKKLIRVQDLNIVLILDPATTGKLGYTVVGTDEYGRHFVLEAVQEERQPAKQMQKFFELYAKYRFRAMVIEEVLFSALYEPWIKAEFKLRNTYFEIIMVKTEQKAKEERVKGLDNEFSNGNLFFNETFYTKDQDKTRKYSDLIYQILKFGSIKDYHILDALAYLPRVARRGVSKDLEANRIKKEKEMLAIRPATGYSEIKYKTG